MRKFLLWLLLSVPLYSSPNPVPAQLHSVIKFETNSSQCTAFSVAPGVYMTAAHCFEGTEDDVVLDQGMKKTLGKLLKLDREHDYAAFGSDTLEPGLSLGAEPQAGDELWQVGFAGGSPFALWWEGTSMGTQFIENLGWRVILNHRVYPGMSGGPILNAEGKVVGMNQMSNESIALSMPYKEFKKFFLRLGGS